MDCNGYEFYRYEFLSLFVDIGLTLNNYDPPMFEKSSESTNFVS